MATSGSDNYISTGHSDDNVSLCVFGNGSTINNNIDSTGSCARVIYIENTVNIHNHGSLTNNTVSNNLMINGTRASTDKYNFKINSITNIIRDDSINYTLEESGSESDGDVRSSSVIRNPKLMKGAIFPRPDDVLLPEESCIRFPDSRIDHKFELIVYKNSTDIFPLDFADRRTQATWKIDVFVESCDEIYGYAKEKGMYSLCEDDDRDYYVNTSRFTVCRYKHKQLRSLGKGMFGLWFRFLISNANFVITFTLKFVGGKHEEIVDRLTTRVQTGSRNVVHTPFDIFTIPFSNSIHSKAMDLFQGTKTITDRISSFQARTERRYSGRGHSLSGSALTVSESLMMFQDHTSNTAEIPTYAVFDDAPEMKSSRHSPYIEEPAFTYCEKRNGIKALQATCKPSINSIRYDFKRSANSSKKIMDTYTCHPVSWLHKENMDGCVFVALSLYLIFILLATYFGFKAYKGRGKRKWKNSCPYIEESSEFNCEKRNGIKALQATCKPSIDSIRYHFEHPAYYSKKVMDKYTCHPISWLNKENMDEHVFFALSLFVIFILIATYFGYITKKGRGKRKRRISG